MSFLHSGAPAAYEIRTWAAPGMSHTKSETGDGFTLYLKKESVVNLSAQSLSGFISNGINRER